jgi:hypothetical protein
MRYDSDSRKQFLFDIEGENTERRAVILRQRIPNDASEYKRTEAMADYVPLC